MYWRKYSNKEINKIIFNAINKNINYRKEPVLGIPASYLDPLTFYDDAPFLKDSAFITSLIENSNHIGCHTLTYSEPAFTGTQEIEKDLIRICAEEILSGDKEQQEQKVDIRPLKQAFETMLEICKRWDDPKLKEELQ